MGNDASGLVYAEVPGRPKRLFRCYEKTAFEGKEGERCCLRGLVDVTRAAILCTSLAALCRVVSQICASEEIVVVRLKNRLETPTDAGWSDVLINFYFRHMIEGQNLIMSELQVIPEKMMTVRKQMGAHQ